VGGEGVLVGGGGGWVVFLNLYSYGSFPSQGKVRRF